MSLISNQKMKLKGGALLYSVFLSVVILIVISMIVILSQYKKQYVGLLVKQEQMYLNLESAVNLISSTPRLLYNTEIDELDLFDDNSEFVAIERRKWGMYPIIKLTTSWMQYSVSKVALFGGINSSDRKTSLYLEDHFSKLKICGNTIIKGECYIPETGFDETFIEGSSFSGSIPTKASIHKSMKVLPKLNSSLMDWIIDFGIEDQESFIWTKYEDYDDSTVIQQSFNDAPLVINLPNNSTLSDKYIIGAIVLRSTHAITIEAGCKLEDVILQAPAIIVEDGFRGNFQAFATDSIIIGERVTLKYPSVLLLDKRNCTSKGRVALGKESTVRGSIVVTINKEEDTNCDLFISENSKVHGQVYCNGCVQHQGKIEGSLYCSSFILRTNSAVYKNQLLDAEIDVTKQSPYYYGPDIFNQSTKVQLIKWLE